MTPWTQITAEDVLGECFSNAESQALIGQNATGSLAGMIAKAVNAWRGDITIGGGPLGPDGTLPNSIVPDVQSYIAWRWLSTSPGLEQYKTSDRRDLYKDAMDLRKSIKKGETKVELPDPTDPATAAAVTTPPVNQVERVSGRRTAQPHRLNGFL
jgi:hypothetical protein